MQIIQYLYRFYFFSRKETRRHTLVISSDGEVKIWMEPRIETARIINLSEKQVNEILKIVENRKEEQALWYKLKHLQK